MIEVPDKFKEDLKETRKVIEEVNKHYQHLEGMLLYAIHSDIADRASMFIGVPDTGKSRVADVIAKNVNQKYRGVIKPHGLTTNGLKYYQEAMSGHSNTVIVEDLSRSGTPYMQIQTVAVLAGLSYGGAIEKHNQAINLSIENAKMSALIFAQPLIERHLVSVDEFDSDIRDKCMRYYHLYRPSDPYPYPLELRYTAQPLDYGKEVRGSTNETVIENLRNEVSKGRAIEHCQALLRASARFNGREEVSNADHWFIEGLTNNMRLEGHIFTKRDLEGPRGLNINAIPVFTAFLSFPKNTVKSIGVEFGVSERRTREIILNQLSDWAEIDQDFVRPKKEAIEILKEIQFDGGKAN